MACFKPLPAFLTPAVYVATGKPVYKVLPRSAWTDRRRPKNLIPFPCGQCIGCRLERSRQWAMRCVHEASLHSMNAFLTLTYRPSALPPGGTLIKKHHQDFLKRYRFWSPRKIRFFHCGEYGEQGYRPHYHTLIFGHDFQDKEYLKNVNGNDYFTSKKLEDLWSHGHCLIGAVTFESAAYVARYVTKKITGPDAHAHYNQINYETGEILRERIPEYVLMSRRPGIGAGWLSKYSPDVFPSDEVAFKRNDRYITVRPPKFYSKMFERDNPEEMVAIKARRIAFATLPEVALNNSQERLAAREEFEQNKFKLFAQRSFEK